MADFTIGMATYDDYDGVFFTIQAIRMFHREVSCDFVVVDNHPGSNHSGQIQALASAVPNFRHVPFGDWTGTGVKNLVFEHAASERVVCLDCHVLLVPGALAALRTYMDHACGRLNLIQGPLLYDDLSSISTHFEPGWSGGMYGTWATDTRGLDPAAEPFAIPMQGCGLMACYRTAWPGLHPDFRGFGAEEWYLHEKCRRAGGQVMCLPALRWMHRFNRPNGPPFPNTWEARVRNYLIGWSELGLSLESIYEHFDKFLGQGFTARVAAQGLAP